jgi:hypothetical protein
VRVPEHSLGHGRRLAALRLNMTEYVTSDLLSRREFLKEYGFSDSAERRGRTEGNAWPPHVVIGQKKIYYRRRSVERWLAQQERVAAPGHRADLGALFPTLDEDAHRLAKELVERAPALSHEQLDSIRAVIVGGGDRR